MARWTWGMLLSLLLLAGCGQQPKPETSPSASDSKSKAADHRPQAGEAGTDEQVPILTHAKPLPGAMRAGNEQEPEKSDRVDIGGIEETPPAELNVDPTLQDTALAAKSGGWRYNPGDDGDEVIEHKTGCVGNGMKDVESAAGGASAFGPGPRVSGPRAMAWGWARAEVSAVAVPAMVRLAMAV